MKLSRKRAIELACWEEEIRHGYEPPEDEPSWTLKDHVIQEESFRPWMMCPGSMIAAMRYDGVLDMDIKSLRRFLGDKLYQDALVRYWNGDHDT